MVMLPGIVQAYGEYDSRGGDECRAQVNANDDALAEQMRAQGNLRGVGVVSRKHRSIDLAACAQMDRRAQDALMTKAYARLSSAIDTLKARRSISADERRVLAVDHQAILGFPRAPYRDACLRLHSDFVRYEAAAPELAPAAHAAAQVFRCTGAGAAIEFSQRPCAAGATQTEMAVQALLPDRSPSAAQCAEFKLRIDRARKAHDRAVAALLPPRSAESGWREANERRLTALSEWQWLRDRAQAAGCISQ